MFDSIVKKFNYAMTRIPQQRNDIRIPAYVLDKYRQTFNVKENENRDDAKRHIIKSLTLGKLVYTYKSKKYIKYWDLCLQIEIVNNKETVTNVWRDLGNKMYPCVKVTNVQKKKYDDLYGSENNK